MAEREVRQRRRGGKRVSTGAGSLPNLSPPALDYLAKIEPRIRAFEAGGALPEIDGPGGQSVTPALNLDALLWQHILAVLFTPAYNRENQEALRQDWPRLPIPNWRQPEALVYGGSALGIFAGLGRRIGQLLSPEPLNPDDWHRLASLAALSPSPDQTCAPGDLRLSDAWSVPTKDNAVRPGKGEVIKRGYTTKEEAELAELLRSYRVIDKDVGQVFGDQAVDVIISRNACWRGIPETVWDFAIGGHRVLSKWLSYRGGNIIERDLTLDECCRFKEIARRLILLAAIGLRLDYNWPRLVNEANW
jgi:hypothetical protein